jgi:hypothetical protein
MSSILVHHHLGLGDHIMCHGIVREYAKKYDRVGLFSHVHNYPSVSFMYRDLKNLTVIKGDDNFARDFIEKNKTATGPEKYDEVKIIGFDLLDRDSGMSLERQFYKIAGVPIEKKWDSFYVDRDLKTEQALYDRLDPKEDYVFLHEDATRDFTINRRKIDPKFPIIVADHVVAPNFFDYCTIIEKAKEIHVIDSSFMFLIDCLQYENPNQRLVIHRYARENPKWKLPILKKNWEIILLENYTTGVVKYLKDQLHEIKFLRNLIEKAKK